MHSLMNGLLWGPDLLSLADLLALWLHFMLLSLIHISEPTRPY